MLFAKVAVPAPIWTTLTYCINRSSLHKTVEHEGDLIGRRVLVPLGKRKITGYVLSVSPKRKTDFTVKSIVEIIDAVPLFHSNLIPFFHWISSYYHHPIGLVVETALPGGLLRKSGKRLVVTSSLTNSATELAELTEIDVEFFDYLNSKGSLSIAATKKLLAERKSKRIIEKLIQKGLVILEERIQQETSREKKESCYRVVSESGLPSIEEHVILNQFEHHSELVGQNYPTKLTVPEYKTLFLLEILGKNRQDGFVSGKELRKHYSGSSTKLLKQMVQNDLLVHRQKRIYRNPFGEEYDHVDTPEKLSDEQQNVLADLLPAIQSKSYKPYLLHGVTGCGKTEVYLRCAEETLRMGRDVLVLVPEIALATQLEAGFVSRFGDQVVLLHSGLTIGQKYDQWSLAAISKARIVIGARSAIFAPLKDPGLIVVDEEHDGAYKQDDGLKYNGRDLALLRGRYHDSVVLLGSATPSVTSFFNACSSKYTLLAMKKRVAERSLPHVQIVDMNQSRDKGAKKLFSDLLINNIQKTLNKNKQSLLLLNRRGFSTVVLCQECGNIVQCRHCHVSMTYHKKKNSLICHYCNFQQKVQRTCEKCQTESLAPFGFGTERVVEELYELFPQANIVRLDSDTGADRRKFLKVLKSMRKREIDILVGTQMIAKGHHFPHVTLVGVVWADSGLSIPDFRAGEKTFQLLSQVTGRAGRGEELGEVVIQTMHPKHYAIDYAAGHDYSKLYEHEINIRKTVGFPPFTKLINLRVTSESEFDTRQSAQRIGSFCRKNIHAMEKSIQVADRGGVELSGPAPSPIDRIQGKYRWQLLLKSPDIDLLHTLCGRVISQKNELLTGKATLAVDVDPENMM